MFKKMSEIGTVVLFLCSPCLVAAESNIHEAVSHHSAIASGVADTVFEDEFESFAVQVLFPRTGLRADELGVIVNDNDPLSIELANQYVIRRGIPAANVVHISIPSTTNINRTDFQVVYDQVNAALPSSVQATLLTWTAPYRVDCMSITSAFAFGFDEMWCNTSGVVCASTAASPVYLSETTNPYVDLNVRPSMMLAASNVADGVSLIQRGISSDGSLPTGDGYLMRTTDALRSIRWFAFTLIPEPWIDAINFTYIDNSDGSGSNVISNTNDVLFYFTGLSNVASIDTNSYLPGAVADHLTSFGGRIPSSQMSVIKWLEAGVTGSFGTVIEPCNYASKFTDVRVLLDAYFRGGTLIESYWKSLHWPGEGLFVGEPLARPFERQVATTLANEVILETNAILPDDLGWVVQGSASEAGPWEFVQVVVPPATRSRLMISVPRPTFPVLRLIRQ